ncbi:unnamed protein product [Ilex paraguariensis]|uniref:Uncharacterized protein n=1 Tax=Ilex paraguariensis TaxID=185542 RepID=A0ABC8U3A1_9AQUA
MCRSWRSFLVGCGHSAKSAKALFIKMCFALVGIVQYSIDGRRHRKTWLKPSSNWIGGTSNLLVRRLLLSPDF